MNAYDKGFIDGMSVYAVNRDGKQWVGSPGIELKKAIERRKYLHLYDKGRKSVVVGDVVQINPDSNPNQMFAACMVTVTELKSWGVQGFVQALGENAEIGGRAFIRLKHGEFEPVGTAEWVPNTNNEES